MTKDNDMLLHTLDFTDFCCAEEEDRWVGPICKTFKHMKWRIRANLFDGGAQGCKHRKVYNLPNFS